MKIEGLITAAAGNSQTSDVKYEDVESEAPDKTTDNMFLGEYDQKEEVGDRRKNQPRPERTVAVTVNDNSAANDAIQEHLGKEDGVYLCKVCNYNSNHKTKVTLHIETHIEGLSYSCSDCDKTFRLRASLNKHIYRSHK